MNPNALGRFASKEGKEHFCIGVEWQELVWNEKGSGTMHSGASAMFGELERGDCLGIVDKKSGMTRRGIAALKNHLKRNGMAVLRDCLKRELKWWGLEQWEEGFNNGAVGIILQNVEWNDEMDQKDDSNSSA